MITQETKRLIVIKLYIALDISAENVTWHFHVHASAERFIDLKMSKILILWIYLESKGLF